MKLAEIISPPSRNFRVVNSSRAHEIQILGINSLNKKQEAEWRRKGLGFRETHVLGLIIPIDSFSPVPQTQRVRSARNTKRFDPENSVPVEEEEEDEDSYQVS